MTAGRLEAVLWDMDGLLVDSEPLWTVAERELAARWGAVFTPEAKHAVVGTRLDVAVPLLLGHFGVPATPERVLAEMAWLLARMVVLFGERELPLRPGAGALLSEVAAAGCRQALVSSSYRRLVDAVLAHGVGPFALTLAGDEVGAGKPDPEPYLRAAAGLGVSPEHCVVLEDSPAGVAAGLAAGCPVVGVPSVPGVELGAAPGLVVRPSLTGLSFEELQSMTAAVSASRRGGSGRSSAS